MAAATLPKMPKDVASAFASYPPAIAARLKAVRQLIFATAASEEAIGPLVETLKWGEPAYLTARSKIGSTIRLGWPRTHPECCAIYFNCNTTLVDSFRTLFRDELTFVGNRAILLDPRGALPKKPLSICVMMALTYHQKARRRSA